MTTFRPTHTIRFTFASGVYGEVDVQLDGDGDGPTGIELVGTVDEKLAQLELRSGTTSKLAFTCYSMLLSCLS